MSLEIYPDKLAHLNFDKSFKSPFYLFSRKMQKQLKIGNIPSSRNGAVVIGHFDNKSIEPSLSTYQKIYT